MTTTTTTDPVAETNGVPTAKLFGTIEKVKAQPELGAFRWTARNRWVEGTASTSTIHEWFGVGTDHVHAREWTLAADHPTLGHGHGPTPHETVLHALAACISAGIATGAAARGVELRRIDIEVRAAMDVRGVLGIDPAVRKGFSQVQVDVDVDADATEEVVAALVEGGRRYSAVFDMLTNPTPVDVRIG